MTLIPTNNDSVDELQRQLDRDAKSQAIRDITATEGTCLLSTPEPIEFDPFELTPMAEISLAVEKSGVIGFQQRW